MVLASCHDEKESGKIELGPLGVPIQDYGSANDGGRVPRRGVALISHPELLTCWQAMSPVWAKLGARIFRRMCAK
jgi:hypothetical protein